MKKVIPTDAVLVPDNATKAFEGKIFSVYQWQQEMFDGSKHTFEMLKRTDTVTAICVVDDKILMLDDEQPHMGSRQSFPGGRVDDTDESMEAAAQREVLEETGYSFKNWRLVKVNQPYRKIEWFVYVFLAWDVLGQETPQLDSGEKITVHQLAFDDLKSQVMQPETSRYLGDNVVIFEPLSSIDELLQLPTFSGVLVDIS